MHDDAPDPTAGRTAQAIRNHPEIPRPLTDPTDPRLRDVPDASEEMPMEDPTDPRLSEDDR
jgi:hypothetical protein